MDHPHISVCICTFRRQEMLSRLLESLNSQDLGAYTFSVVVADNDRTDSARNVIARHAATARYSLTYVHESRQNIARARNAALRYATGDFVAFIDDDELPQPNWLVTLVRACTTLCADGVLGPVRPHFEHSPASWIVKGQFFDRPEHETGRIMPWAECRTGNLLFRRSIVCDRTEVFDEAFDCGGEDIDFFMRMTKAGHVFKWCNEAIVYETVPTERCARRYLLKRALLRGRNNLKLSGRLVPLLLKSALAVPIYLVALPFAVLLDHHCFMQLCVRLCDHLGRLLTLVGLNPVRER